MTLTSEQREVRDHHRFRLDAARVLVDLEEQAFHADLPVLDWQISVGGPVGRPRAIATPEQAEATFIAWADHLEAAVSEPGSRTYPVPARVLWAIAKVPHPQASTGTVRVVLTAEIELDEEN